MGEGRERDEVADVADRVLSGEAWADFCDALKAAGDLVVDRSDEPIDRVEGFRFLSRLLRGGLESYVEAGDARFPLIRSLPDQVKIGSDNPDSLYQSVNIDGRLRYRLWGSRGTVHYLGLGAYAGNYGSGQGRLGLMGYLDGSDLEIDDGGRFEVFLSQEPEGPNWIRTLPESGMLAIRQFFLDRDSEEPAQLQIERLDADETPAPLSASRFGKALGESAAFVDGCSTLFTDWADRMRREQPNQLRSGESATGETAWGDPNQIFYHGYWQVGPGEALLIEFTPPECFYWNFQLDNRWMESLDYRWLPVTVNKHSARYEPDGSVRIVVAESDPGFGNWMDLAGHSHGAMGLRWNQATEDVAPECRHTTLADLAGAS